MENHSRHHHENPNQKISPSSVYYCPMECEGEKLYFQPGRCKVCNMFLVPIEEKNGFKKTPEPKLQNQEKNAGKYYCPMFCEGDKVYDSNVGCPVCGMDLVQIPGKNGEIKEDKTLLHLKRNYPDTAQ